MPEEYAEYLAYKMIIEYDQLTKDERDEIFTEKGVLLLKKINGFHERRYNGVGKHLLYLSFESFLHIYFRHVKELSVANQDLEATMNVVLHAFNEKYQELKEKNPDNRCFCKGSQTYYYNGDYYDIDVHPDGHIASFYKREK